MRQIYEHLRKSGRSEITPYQQQGYQIKVKSLYQALENVADVTIDNTNVSKKDEANSVSNEDTKTDIDDTGKKVEKLQSFSMNSDNWCETDHVSGVQRHKR